MRRFVFRGSLIVLLASLPVKVSGQQMIFGRMDSIGQLDVLAKNYRCDIALGGNLVIRSTAGAEHFVRVNRHLEKF